MAGTRDRLAHAYFDVDLDLLWQISSVDLHALVATLETALTDSK
ncbi:MAG: HepT-like ribonuclease domain-containing protein [Vicinamibacterales bacterium]